MNKDYQTQSASTATMTVYQSRYILLRQLGLTRIFCNPGSTEQPFLSFPNRFPVRARTAGSHCRCDGQRVRASDAAAGAGQFAQLSWAGNAMGNIVTAYQNKTRLIITAGQQTRSMLLHEPLLTNRDETVMLLRSVSTRFAPDPERIAQFADRIRRSKRTALVY